MSKYLDVLIVGTIGFLFHYFLISWLVEGSYWLHIFLALSFIAPVTSKMYEDIDGKIKQLQSEFVVCGGRVILISFLIKWHIQRISWINWKITNIIIISNISCFRFQYCMICFKISDIVYALYVLHVLYMCLHTNICIFLRSRTFIFFSDFYFFLCLS